MDAATAAATIATTTITTSPPIIIVIINRIISLNFKDEVFFITNSDTSITKSHV